MKAILYASLLLITLASCEKDPVPPAQTPVPHPTMRYTDIAATVKPGRTRTLDIDGDGGIDFVFGVQRVGDPILQVDRVQYLVNSLQKRNLLVNEAEESPRLRRLERIGLVHTGFHWYEIASIVLAEKFIGMSESWWDGIWKTADHHYLPVQMDRPEGKYQGWVEISFSTITEELILHRAALSLEANKEIQAGY